MTKITLTNAIDNAKCEEGLLRPEQVRTLELEAMVDTGATMLALPEDVALALGLRELRRTKVRLADGSVREVGWVTDLRLGLCGRDMTTDALVMPAGSTPLIGQIPLEALDLVVDPKSRDVTVNPASPDMPTLDLLHVA